MYAANSNQNLELLQDIINGYSIYLSRFGKIYFKHLDIFSYEKNLNFYSETCEQLKSEGVLSEQDQIENASQNGFWSKEKENSISSISETIKRMIETKKKLFYPSDKKRVDEQIKQQKIELKKLEIERDKYISFTVEYIANHRAIDFYIKNFTYIDENLSDKFFPTDESFEYADTNLINNIYSKYYSFLTKTSLYNIQKLALCTYFQNILIVSTRPQEIFGKPIFKLTKAQTDLLIWGKYFQNILRNTLEDVPDKLTDDPEKFMEWVNGLKEKNKQKNKQKKSKKGDNNSSSKFLFGSSEDIRHVTGESGISGNKILQESSKKGGLNMQELMDK